MNLENMTVKNGETVNRTKIVDTESNTVQLYNVSKNDKTGLNYKVDWTFDFTNCTQAEILDLAARSAVIAYRKTFRVVDKDTIPEFAERTIDVHSEVIAQERSKANPVDKARKLLNGMTQEQKEAILKELGL